MSAAQTPISPSPFLPSSRSSIRSRFLGVLIPKLSSNLLTHPGASGLDRPTQQSSNQHSVTEPITLQQPKCSGNKSADTPSANTSSFIQLPSSTRLSPTKRSMLNPLLPTRFEASPPVDLRSDLQEHPQPSSYALETPLVIRSLIRRFSPPFKPFGSKEVEPDHDSPGSSNHHPIVLSPTLSAKSPLMPSHHPYLNPSASADPPPNFSSPKRTSIRRVPSSHDLSQKSHMDGKMRSSEHLSTSRSHTLSADKDNRSRRHGKRAEGSIHTDHLIESDEEFAARDTQADLSQDERPYSRLKSKSGTRRKTKTPNPRSSKALSHSRIQDSGSPNLEHTSKAERTHHKSTLQEKRRKHSRDSDESNFNPNISDTKITPRSPRPERNRVMRHVSLTDLRAEDLDAAVEDVKAQGDHDQPLASTSSADASPRPLPTRDPTAKGTTLHTRTRTLSGASEEDTPFSPSGSTQVENIPSSEHVGRVNEESDDEPPRKQPRPKRPKPPVLSTASTPSNAPNMDQEGDPSHMASPGDGSAKPVYRIPQIIPACEPDDFGQYESSTCHQCRVKTTRPKMICDQSQDPNCVVRVCHMCLMLRTVYDGQPELRPPIFTFVPGGRMLCVKCRNICPCASCRRRRGEQEQCRRGLGNGTKGFYGLTPEERERALERKKEKQEIARQKKDSRPPTEKKTPVVCRREAAAIRHTGFDDDIEQERLQHWAPLPVFPPLPPARKKKRKRPEPLDPLSLDCKTSRSASESSCSDSDTNDDTDTDDMSMSSESSQGKFRARTNSVLDPATFNLSLTSHVKRDLNSIPRRWRSNGTRDDGVHCPEHVYRAVKRKHKHKAPVVWIKGGAIVQARKPPTKEFMAKLAEEQKGKSSCASTVVDDDGRSPVDGKRQLHCDEQEEVDISNLTLINNVGMDEIQFPINRMTDSSHTPYVPEDCLLTDDDLALRRSVALLGDPSKSDWLAASPEGRNRYGHLSLHAAMQRTHTLPDLPTLNEPSNPFVQSSNKVPIDSNPQDILHGPRASPDSGRKPLESTHAIPTDPARKGTSDTCRDLHSFESDATPLDHQTYLAGLTDEQLTDVLKQGNYVMAKRGFLPPPITNTHSPMKYPLPHEYSAGISPELISASLPVASTSESMQMPGDPQPMLTDDLTEEDQQMRLIEAASWAAVWGATDGVGGFSLTHGGEGESGEEKRPSTTSSISSPSWENESGDKELFLKAMKSSVGDEWLTDVMPLDSSY